MTNSETPPNTIKKDFVYSRIGRALISTQRVEYLPGELLKLLMEFDKDIYHITTSEFHEHISLIAISIAYPGKQDKLKAAQQKLVEETVKESGCVRYELHQSSEENMLQ